MSEYNIFRKRIQICKRLTLGEKSKKNPKLRNYVVRQFLSVSSALVSNLTFPILLRLFCIREVNIAANASEVQGFQDVSVKLDEASKQTKQHNYGDAMKLVSEAISITTTNGNKAAETLKEKDLI